MLGLILAGLFGRGVHSAYKDAELEAEAQAADSPLLMSCTTQAEVIEKKCLFYDSPNMPRLTLEELKVIEGWYRDGYITEARRMAYLDRTGNTLSDVIEKRRL